jgi:hypothetical protein
MMPMEITSILTTIITALLLWLVGRYFGRINGYSVGFDEGYSAGSAIRRNKVGTTFQKKLVKTSVRQKNNKKII